VVLGIQARCGRSPARIGKRANEHQACGNHTGFAAACSRCVCRVLDGEFRPNPTQGHPRHSSWMEDLFIWQGPHLGTNNWVVVTNYLCPDSRSIGTLYLGPSKGAACSPEIRQGNSVTVTPLPAGTADQSQCSIRLNGLRVYFGPCTSSNAAGVIFYDIPSLGIRAEGMGRGNENVTGPGTGTVVGQVLHTLRRR
jgi:hypothetical protein